MKKSNKYLLTTLSVIYLISVFLILYAAMSTLSIPFVTVAMLFAVLSAADLIIIVALNKSLKTSLYLYKNILLISAFIFVTALCVFTFFYFVSGLDTYGMSAKSAYSTLISLPTVFSYIATGIIAAVCIALIVSNIALIKHEGFRPKNLLGILLAALYIGGSTAVYILNAVLSKSVSGENIGVSVSYTVTAVSVFTALLICYFECFLFASAYMGYKAARQVPKYDKDFIIILGCSIDKKGGLLPLLKGRVNRAMKYAWQQEIDSGKPLKYVPSGGKGSNEIMSEGSAMELYLKSKGAEDYEVFPEKESKNTLENMLFSKKIIDTQMTDAKIAFATTNYHMLRSGIIARNAGIDAEGIAGETKWYFWPNGFIREFFGILLMNKKVHLIIAAVLAVISCLISLVGIII